MAGQTPYSNLGRYLQDLKKKRENKSKTLQGKKLGKAPAVARMEYQAENKPATGYGRASRSDRETVYRMRNDPYAYGREVAGTEISNIRSAADRGIRYRDYPIEEGERRTKERNKKR